MGELCAVRVDAGTAVGGKPRRHTGGMLSSSRTMHERSDSGVRNVTEPLSGRGAGGGATDMGVGSGAGTLPGAGVALVNGQCIVSFSLFSFAYAVIAGYLVLNGVTSSFVHSLSVAEQSRKHICFPIVGPADYDS